jgi:squalene synthase HpnC
VEGPRPGRPGRLVSDVEDLASGKGHSDENFPVASALIAPRHRPVVLAFYRVARLSDDIADHSTLSSSEKLSRLGAIEASLTGRGADVPAAVRLRAVLAEQAITGQHILDLLEAFRRDAVKKRYADWGELMDYCRYSAAPVGRFVLDVHGESPTTWPASDALCAALQVINHLQDCGKDYRDLDRVYVPLDALAAAGLDVAALGEPVGGPALRGVIAGLAKKTQGLLQVAKPLQTLVRDLGLGLEIGVIQALAESLDRRLQTRDPLSERVHHTKPETLLVALSGAAATLAGRLIPRSPRRREA